ncbi:MAG: hypothetical protein JO270_22990 [Acidobacteriaceae bacterium]|nr:hypothetical protein [Acidobacteriaceae bacterium]
MTPETVKAWNASVEQAQARLHREADDPNHFLDINAAQATLQPMSLGTSAIISSPRGGGSPVPSGLIHHWFGTIFIPDANVSELLAALQDYSGYSSIYNPGVVQSRELSRDGDRFTYELKFAQKGFGVKAGLLAEFKANYCRLTPEEGYAVTRATELTELADVGTPQERPVSFSASHGYVEDVFTIVRYRQARGGVYVQVESLTLSRDVPAALRWAVSPLIERFSRQTIQDTLQRLRKSVQSAPALEARTPEPIVRQVSVPSPGAQ